MTTGEALSTLQRALQVVSARGDQSTADALARHIGDLSVELALGGRDETESMPGKRLHRMEVR
ncbi:hypothetical protein [Mycolicibacterium goodii]|uniref:hypothetical protein n=1 Tax=Mycolicibacterium goodii TaxID=134601 RepID=UPI001BDD3B40|nr:hypothetical protein [Mycolicibacterium goodii]MBU8834453.1 hypothetical protein [Mycolicibacterium goodii]